MNAVQELVMVELLESEVGAGRRPKEEPLDLLP